MDISGDKFLKWHDLCRISIIEYNLKDDFGNSQKFSHTLVEDSLVFNRTGDDQGAAE